MTNFDKFRQEIDNVHTPIELIGYLNMFYKDIADYLEITIYENDLIDSCDVLKYLNKEVD